jgi:hypothetical protein
MDFAGTLVNDGGVLPLLPEQQATDPGEPRLKTAEPCSAAW